MKINMEDVPAIVQALGSQFKAAGVPEKALGSVRKVRALEQLCERAGVSTRRLEDVVDQVRRASNPVLAVG